MSKFKVINRDVDGSSTKRYASLKGAVKQFEAMSGQTPEQALSEMFYNNVDAGLPVPSLDDVIAKGHGIRAVGMFGNVVILYPVQA